MKRTVTGTVLLALLFFFSSVRADLRFERYDSEHGLSQESITFIYQDSHGFVWIGTEDGLNRYDGYHFEVYRHQSNNERSLSDNFVTALAEDSRGDLWISTYNGGINRFDRDTEQFVRYRHNPDNDKGLPDDRIYHLNMMENDQLWLGLLGEVVNMDVRQPDKPVFNALRLPSSGQSDTRKHRAHAITQGLNGNIWIGTEGSGLYRYQQSDETFEQYLNDPQNPDSLSGNNIQDIYLDKSKTLWVATNNGLSRFHRSDKQFTHFRHDPTNYYSISDNQVNQIREDNKDRLWVATSNGLSRLDKDRRSFTRFMPDMTDKHSLTNGFVEELTISKDNVLWIGLKTNGVNKSNLNAEQFNLTQADPNDPDSLSGNIIWSMDESHNGNIWIGTSDGGLNYFDRTTGKFKHYLHDKDDPNTLSSNRIYAVLESAPGEVWVGTVTDGVNFFDINNNKVQRFRFDAQDPNSLSNNTILNIFQDAKRRIWIATRSGLNRFNPQERNFTRYLHDEQDPFSLGDNLVGDIYQTDPGSLWLGTAGNGLNHLDINSGKFTHYSHIPGDPTTIVNNAITSITRGEKNKLWLSTMSGADRFDIIKRTFDHALKLDHSIYVTFQEGNNIWFNSNLGLGRMNLLSNEIVHFDVKDGLQNNEFNFGAHLQTSDGTLFFGGINGLNYFNPYDIKTEEKPPKVTLTQLKLFNKPVAVSLEAKEQFTLDRPIYMKDKLTLSHKETLLTLTFSTLEYANINAVQFQYKLDSDGGDWIDTEAKIASATYTNLASGEHNFLVRAKRKNGTWGQPTQLTIEVNPPPWRSWWAYTIYFLIVAAVVSDFFYQRHLKFKAIDESRQKLADMNEHLDELVTKRTAELSETLEQLKDTQDALVESKKMASLIGVVVGVAHEMNTPLGIATTALSRLRLDIDNLVEKFKHKQLSRKDLEFFNDAGIEAVELANSNLHRASLLINRFKALSEQSNQDKLQQVSLPKLLQQVIDRQNAKISQAKAIITIDCPDALYLQTYPNLLGSILEQLIENSLLHGAIDGKPLKLNITAFKNDDDINLIYSDNGKGLESDEQGQLFEPFYTTKRGSDCTGLGMSIVYNQITHQLGGTISYKSVPDQGLTLKIDFAQQQTTQEVHAE